jgi:hypothetical protein
MSQVRGQIAMGANTVRAQQVGDVLVSQYRKTAIATVGAGTLTAAAITNGVIERTGPTAGYTDTFATAEQILQAAPLNTGDSFSLMIRNTVAFAMTAAAGVGIVLGTNVDIPASNCREYLLTVLSIGHTQILAATTTNASAVVSGLTPAQAALLMPGMGVTGTGIPASTNIIGVNSTTGTVTLSANATATATLVGLTFFPRVLVEGIFTAAL